MTFADFGEKVVYHLLAAESSRYTSIFNYNQLTLHFTPSTAIARMFRWRTALIRMVISIKYLTYERGDWGLGVARPSFIDEQIDQIHHAVIVLVRYLIWQRNVLITIWWSITIIKCLKWLGHRLTTMLADYRLELKVYMHLFTKREAKLKPKQSYA